MTRVETLTRYVKNLDRDLFCKQEGPCVLVCRKATVWEEFHMEGSRVLYSRTVPQVIFALTDTFTQKGNPIDLGIEPLLHRIKQIDGYGDFSTTKNIIPDLEKDAEYKKKDLSSKFEEMAYETRPMFKKAFADVNTSNMDMKKDKRRIQDGSH
jgi:hypothetical protein